MWPRTARPPFPPNRHNPATSRKASCARCLSCHHRQRFFRGHEPNSQPLKLSHTLFSSLGRQSLNSIPHHGHAPLTFQQTLDRKADTIFSDHSKNNKFRLIPQSLYEFIRVQRLKDVQRLFLQSNLLPRKRIVRQFGIRRIFNAYDLTRQRFGQQLRARRASYAMWRKLRELRIIRSMEITGRNQQHFIAARGIRQPAYIWQQLLRARHIQLAPRQHEVPLHIDFPEDEIL